MDKATEELYEEIKSGAKFGGPVVLTEVTHLKPAGGEHELIAPAKYSIQNSKLKDEEKGTYVFEVRFIEGKPVNTVLIDSRSSAVNRMEQALQDAINEGRVEALKYMPRIKVSVVEEGSIKASHTDLELPHRAFDSTVRFANEIKDEKSDRHKRYEKARKATQREALDLFDLSPITVLFGGWDSYREDKKAKKKGTKFPSAVMSETTGCLAHQNCKPEETVRRRSGARLDPVVEEGGDSKKGIGMIPPGTKMVDGVAVKDIIRTHILSFSTLRQLRFYDAGEKIAEKNESIRTLLACVAIYGFVAANENLTYRSHCQLSLKEPPECIIEYSSSNIPKHFDPISFDQAKELLDKAFNEMVDLFNGEKDCPVWAMKDLEKAIFSLEFDKSAL